MRSQLSACPTYDSVTSYCVVQKNGGAVNGRSPPRMFSAATRPMRCATAQCSMRTLLAGRRVRIAGDVAGRVDAGRAGAQAIVDHDAAVDLQAGGARQLERRLDADAEHHQVGGQPFARCPRA